MKIKEMRFVRLLLFFALLSPATAQNFHIQKIEIPDKIKGAVIGSIFQDSKGYLWFGGFNSGLYRYDGYHCVHFVSSQIDSSSISSNNITGIAEDSQGNILIATSNGLNIFNYGHIGFIHFFNDKRNIHSLSDNSITEILKDSHSRIWIGTWNGGLNLFDQKTQQFTQYVHEPGKQNSLSGNHVTALCEAGPDTLWVGLYEGGINKFYVKDNRFEKYFPTEWGHENYLNLNVNVITKSDKGDLWIGTNGNGLFHFDPVQYKLIDAYANTLYKDDPRYSNITSIVTDKLGYVWAGTFRNGMIRIDKNEKISHFEPGGDHSISDWLVACLYKNVGGIIFIGQWGPNLDVLNYLSPDFITELPFAKKRDERDDYANHIKAIFEDADGDLWLGFYKEGLVHYKKGELHNPLHYKTENSGISSNDIEAICENPKGTLWIGSISGGISLFDKKTHQFKRLRYNSNDKNSLSDDNVICLSSDDSIVWIGTANGLNKYNVITKTNTTFFHNEEKKSLSDNFISAVFISNHDHSVWIGTKGGLNHYNKATNNFDHFIKDLNDAASLSDDYVTSITENKSGDLWIGTQDGLNLMDVKNKKFERFYKGHGLSGNDISNVLIDSSGVLWVTSGNKLTKIKPDHFYCRNYDAEDNLYCGDIESGIFQDSKGEIFIAGNNGYMHFNPYQVHHNTIPPSISITSIDIVEKDNWNNQKRISVDDIYAGKIQLAPEENNLLIRFSTFCFKQTSKCRYQYRIKEKGEEWIELGRNNSVLLKNLSAGKYTFEAMGTNNDNYWCEKSASIIILVKPVFWKSIYFFLIILLIIGMATAYYFIWKKRSKTVIGSETKADGPKSAEQQDSLITTDPEVIVQIENLTKIMTDEKLYLNSDLSIKDLAKKITITEKDLSNLLNRHLNKNFADYVNEFRVEEAKKKLLDPSNKDKIIYVAYESGFNSKAAFYTVFKKFTGMTPTDYRNSQGIS